MIRAESVPSTAKEVYNFIKAYEDESNRCIALEEQFKSNQQILHKEPAPSGKPDNRLVDNYPGYISTVNIGYFMGKPVKYTADDEAERMLEELQDFLDYNDEADENVLLAREASIKGNGYELMYLDSESKLRIAMLKPESTIVVYDNTVESNLLFAIRYWQASKDTIKADLYTSTEKTTFIINTKKGNGTSEKPEPHIFEDVPIIEFPNNEERMGDFEKVLTLINAYDKGQSDTADDFDYFSDAYLVIKNLSGTSGDQIDEMKKKRVLLVDGNGDVAWLTKTIQDTASENYKTRLDNDIHKFSMTPKLTDEAFAGNLSGVALLFKLWGLEQLAAQKERKFKKALQRRIELFCKYAKVKGRDYDWRNVDIQFTRNIPMNISDVIDQAVKLKGIVSDQTVLSMLPMIDDPAGELQKMQDEATNGGIDLTDNSEETTQTENQGEPNAVQEPPATSLFPQQGS